MPPRRPEIRSESDAFDVIMRKLETLELTVKRRTLPPGFEFRGDGTGDLTIVRKADGATGTVTFT